MGVDVLVTILIIGAPKKWPEGTEISRGSHDMYTPATRPLWLSNGILYNEDHCNRCVFREILLTHTSQRAYSIASPTKRPSSLRCHLATAVLCLTQALQVQSHP